MTSNPIDSLNHTWVVWLRSYDILFWRRCIIYMILRSSIAISSSKEGATAWREGAWGAMFVLVSVGLVGVIDESSLMKENEQRQQQQGSVAFCK
jgi:hypothetical protein